MKIFSTFSLFILIILSVTNLSAQNEPRLFASALDYCEGDPGVTFGVENSVSGAIYNLQSYNDQNEQWSTIRTVFGNGATVTFGGEHEAGTYRILQDIDYEIEITEKSAPEIFEVTGGGDYCDNTTDYPLIGVSNSQSFSAGVIYELYLDGEYVTEQPGIGNAFNFANPDPSIIGFPDPGIYMVVAILEGCESEMEGFAEVIAHPAPEISYTSGEVQGPYDCGHVEFVASVDGVGDPFSYKWFFTETDSLLTQNNEISFVFPAYGIGTETFEVTLEVTDDNGCVVSQTEILTVHQRPDASLIDILSPDINPPGSTTLAFCGADSSNPEGFFELQNASTTQSTNTWYEIIWGDGSSVYEDNLFDVNVAHEYGNIGSYDLIFTVEGPTVCIGQQNYSIYVGAEPDGGLSQTGSMSGWAPFEFVFLINDTEDNPDGTEYNFNFGDGNSSTFFEVPDGGAYNYTYNTCPTELSQFGRWGYVATLDINNACGDAGGSVYHIYVRCSAEADFGIGDGDMWGGNGLDSLVTCSTVSFNNTSTPGFFPAPDGQSYTEDLYSHWDFGDGNESNEQNPTHTYAEANQWYEVTLTSWTSNNPNNPPDNPNGFTIITKHIFVQGDPEPDFEIGTITGTCAPVEVQLIDQSLQYDYGIQLYHWEIQVLNDEGEYIPYNINPEDANLPFFEDFSDSPEDDWSFPEGQGNWSFGTQHTPPSSISGSPNAFFNWSPSRHNYSYSLNSPVLTPDEDGEIVVLDYMLFLNNFSSESLEQMSVEYKQVDDNDWTLLETFTNEGIGGGNIEHVKTSRPLSGISDQPFEVRFRAHGEYSWSINGWGLDDVKVHHSGKKNPVFVFNESGEYQIRLGITNACGTEYTDWIDIDPIAGPPSVDVLDTLRICGSGFIDITEDYIIYDASLGNITSYTWNVNPSGPEFNNHTFAYPKIETIDITQTYSLTVTVTNECEETESDPLLLMVTQTISGNTISYLGESDYVLCDNSILSDVILGSTSPDLTGGDGIFDYEWYVDEGTGWQKLLGENESSLSYQEEITVNPTRFRRKVISGCCESYSEPLTFSLTPAIFDNTILSDPQVFCEGVIPDEIIADNPTGGDGDYVFTWQQSVEPFTDWVTATGTYDENNYTPPQLDETTHFRRLVESGACIDISDTVIIQVNAFPVILNTQTELTICSGGSTNFAIDFSVSDSSFDWEINGDLDFISIEEDNNTASILDHVLINTSTQNKEVTYTITPIGPPDTFCEGDDFELTVTVRPQFIHSYSNKNIPAGTSTTIDGTLSGGTPGNPPYTYSWTPENMLQTGHSTLANPQTIILNNNQQYTMVATDAAGCTIEIIVDILTAGDEIAVHIESQPGEVVCENSMITLTAEATGGGGNEPEDYTYTWTGLPANHTFTDPPVNRIVEFVPSDLGNNDYSVSAYYEYPATAESHITIQVNEVPEIQSESLHNTCSGSPVNYAPSSSIANTSFDWTSETDSPFVSGNGSGSGEINDVLINTSSEVEHVTYIIIPTGPPPTFCEGDPFELTVAVNPVASVTDTPSSQVVASGQSSVPVHFSSDVNGVSFHWSSEVSCSEEYIDYQYSGEIVGNSIPAQIITILPDGPEACNIIYTIIPVINGCEGHPFTHTIFVTLAPTTFIVSGGGIVCQGESVTVTLDGSEFGINYQLLRNGNLLPGTTIPGNGDVLTWTGISQTGEYTVMGTNVNSGVSEMMVGSAEVNVRPTPQPFTLHTLAPGDNCAPVTPWLNGSQPNVIYQLNRTDPGGAYHPNIQEKTGTGQPLTFDAQENPGTYTVLAIIDHGDAICNREMLGSVIADPLPLQFDILPQGIICEDIEEICIESSETGIVYQLWINEQFVPGTQVTGTGDEICFGELNAPGTYKIHAKNPITGCELFFTETVQVEPLPNIYSMHPTAGCKGTEIILNGCQDGIEYYLFFEPAGDTKEFIEILGPVICNGSETLSFGNHFDEGTYRIKAINPQTNCSVWMDNTTIIHPSPEAFSISPQGGTCPEATIILRNFQYGATYYLYRDGEIVVSTNVINDAVSFEPQSTPGIYTVRAKFAYDNGVVCWTDMLGSLEIYSLPGIFSMLPQGEVCPPASFSLNDSENGTKYTLIHDQSGEIQSITSTGGPISFDAQSSSGNYWIEASNSQGCNATMLNTATILNKPNEYTITPSPGQWCLDEPLVIGLSDSDTGVTYELHRAGAANNPQQSKPGQNGAINFEPVNVAGTYRVRAISDNTGCQHWMFGEIILDNLPIVYNVTVDGLAADGFYCPGIEIGISGSVEGILYDLIHDDEVIETMAGTGAPIVFGTFWDTGEYRAKARDISTNCNSDMNGIIGLYEHPDIFQLVSNNLPLFCTGDDNAITLTLSYAHESTEYQLYKDHSPVPIPIEGPKPGNNNSLSWENISAHGEGDYFVIGRFIADPNCWAPMDGVVTTTEVQKPTAQISGNVSICEGQSTDIEFDLTGFEDHQIRVIYSANGTNQPEVVFDANGSHIVTVSPTTTTVYQVESVEHVEFPHCVGTALGGSVEITVNHLPVANAGADAAICELGFHVLQDASASHHGSIFWEIIEGSGEIIQSDIEKPTYWHYLANDEPVTNTVLQMNVFGEGACAAYVSTSTVTIQIDTLPMADAGPSAVICQNETLEMQDAIALNYSHVLWEVVSGNGVIVYPTYVNAAYIPDESDAGKTVVLMLTAFGDGMCDFAMDQALKTIEVLELPLLSFEINGESLQTGETYSYCMDDLVEISLTNIFSGDPPFDIHWQVGVYSGTTTASVNDVIFSKTPDPGIYPIEINAIIDQNGCQPSDYSDYQALLIIQEPLIAGTATASQTVCYGETPATIMAEEPQGGSGAFEYQWQEYDNNSMEWSNIAGENNLEFQPPELYETTRYRLRQSDFHCNELHTVYTNEVIIYLYDELVAGTAGDDQTICAGEGPEPLIATEPSGGSAAYLYQWEVLNEDTETWEIVDGETGLTIVLPALFETTSYRLRQTDEFCDPPQSVTTNIVVVTVQPGPEVFAGPDAIICENETFILSQAQASGFRDLEWTAMGADGSFDAPDIMNATYTPGFNDIATGVVSLCLTAHPVSPCSTPVTDCMTLTIHPLPQITVGDALPTCVSEDIQVPAGHVTITHVENIEWLVKNPTGGGLVIDENTLMPTYIPNNSNNPQLSDAGKTVVLEAMATGQNGCEDYNVVEELEIKVGAIPETWFTVIDNQADSTRCDNEYVYFRDLTSFGNFTPHPDQIISRRFWEFTNDECYYDTFEAADNIIVKHMFGTDGLFTVRLTVETTIDEITINSVTAEQQVFIHKAPDADFQATQVTHCEYKIQFEDLSTAYNALINSWLWDFGGNNQSMNQNPTFDFSTHGDKNVALKVRDNRGCIGSTEKTITVEPTFDFEISFDPFCFGQETVFYVPSESIEPDGNYITGYIWTFSHTSDKIFAPVAGHTYESPGVYIVSLEATDATGCNKTKNIQFNVPEAIEPTFTVIDCDLNVLFQISPELNDGSIDRWIWDFGDGNIDTLETDIHPTEFYHEYLQHGVYKASLTVADTLGCEGYFVLNNIQTVCDDQLTFLVPNAFAPGDGDIEEWRFFKPKGINIKEYRMQIYDLWGNLLWESTELLNGEPVEYWDGLYRNQPVPQGAYVWKAYVKFTNGKIWQGPNGDGNAAGIVTIIR